jgi:hypothetical protein
VKAHQDDKKPCEELNIWGHLKRNADNMAEKFQKLMDSGDVKALKEGFFMDSMEVGIKVNGVKVMLYILHTRSKCISKGASITSIFKINMIGIMPHGRASTGKE